MASRPIVPQQDRGIIIIDSPISQNHIHVSSSVLFVWGILNYFCFSLFNICWDFFFLLINDFMVYIESFIAINKKTILCLIVKGLSRQCFTLVLGESVQTVSIIVHRLRRTESFKE